MAPRLIRRYGTWLVLTFVALDAALAIGACSSSSSDADAAAEDGSPSDGRDTGIFDAGTDSAADPHPEAGKDAGGRCTPVRGPCDLVLQDCPDDRGVRQECVTSGTTTTACQPVQASQHLPTGRACCPNSAGGNPCLPGLTCVGMPCTDGGPVTGRCSPACCEGDDQACGRSDPEGISGACDLTLVDPDHDIPLHSVCTYRERCKFFGVEPCSEGRVCLLDDETVTSSCVDSFGKGNRESCTFANECADGYVCVGTDDASTCRTVCLRPDAGGPYDASLTEGGPGQGGCPTNEVCNISLTGSPAWFGACAYRDGG